MSTTGIPFQKAASTIAEQIKKLESRGLHISNYQRAEHYLKFIGYYRFAGYCLHFQTNAGIGDERHTFKTGVDFEEILAIYIFDRELRLLVMDAVERIEVAARTAISNRMSIEHKNPHWFLDKRFFVSKFNHEQLIDTIRESTGVSNESKKTLFTKHYYAKYSTPELPPSWMIAEVLSFGAWSLIYKNLANFSDRKAICSSFNIGTPDIFESFLHCIAFVRNICAHHSRLWNRVFTITPKSVFIGGFELKHNSTFYAQAAVIHKLLIPIAPNTDWSTRLYLHLNKNQPHLNAMGVPLNWQKNQFWGIRVEGAAQIS